MSRLTRYIQDTRREMAHVSWPTRAQTVAFTLIVVAICVFAAIYLSIFDAAFTQGLRIALDNAPRFGAAAATATTSPVNMEVASTSSSTTGTPDFTVNPIIPTK